MALTPRGSTPSERGPALRDGTGGASERPSAKPASWVLTDKSGREVDIRLTPTSVDVTTGTPAVAGLYDFGPVSKASIGRYSATYQDAASATADGLGARVHCDFNVLEASAGVFTAQVIQDFEATQPNTRQADLTLTAVADAALDGATYDSIATYFVATAADVTDAAAWTVTPATLVLGNLYLLDAHAASTRVHELERRF